MSILRKIGVTTILLLVSLGILPASSADVPSPGPRPPQTWAIVVGVDKYQLQTITPLRFAGSDAKLLASTLRATMKLPENNTFLFTSDSTDESQRPTLPNIVFRLDWLEKNIDPRDTVLFYFAGHGVAAEDETFLMTEDSDNRSKGTLISTALAGKTLYDQLSRIPAANTLVMLDVCRNDPTRGRGEAPNRLSQEAMRGLVLKPTATSSPQAVAPAERNMATLFACSVGQRSWEWNDRKHGFFTYEIVQGLNSAAYSQGAVTLGSLTKYVQKSVQENTRRNAAEIQTPIVRYDGPGLDSWVLCRNGAKSADAKVEDSRVRVRGANQTTKTKPGDLINVPDPNEANHF